MRTAENGLESGRAAAIVADGGDAARRELAAAEAEHAAAVARCDSARAALADVSHELLHRERPLVLEMLQSETAMRLAEAERHRAGVEQTEACTAARARYIDARDRLQYWRRDIRVRHSSAGIELSAASAAMLDVRVRLERSRAACRALRGL